MIFGSIARQLHGFCTLHTYMRWDPHCGCSHESRRVHPILYGLVDRIGLLVLSHSLGFQRLPTHKHRIVITTYLQCRKDCALSASVRSSNEGHLGGELPALVSVTHEIANFDTLDRSVHILFHFVHRGHSALDTVSRYTNKAVRQKSPLLERVLEI